MNGKRCVLLILVLALAATLALLPVSPVASDDRAPHLPAARRAGQNDDASGFSLAVTADMRGYAGSGVYDTAQYFRGACEAIAALGGGAFMLVPGDLDPPANVAWSIAQYLGQSYLWYPIVGNHDTDYMPWLRAFDRDPNGSDPPDVVNDGPPPCPETTYSFDYRNAHLVVLNEYCDAGGDASTDGDVSDTLYDWLVADLSVTAQQHILVFGHEPAYPQPDADNGRPRHVGDSLDAYPVHRDRFWSLLRAHGVVAYICGHTHNYSAVQVDGVWQLDAGHARGLGDPGAPSTFILVHIDGDAVTFETYRDDALGGPYTLRHVGVLAGYYTYLPIVMRH